MENAEALYTRPSRDIGRVFVDRKREIAELTAALDDALTGQGRMVMVAGEPGIGKTRTVQELASYAEGQGAKVLWGWCYEEQGSPSPNPRRSKHLQVAIRFWRTKTKS